MHKRRASKSLESITIELVDDADIIDDLVDVLASTHVANDEFYVRTLPLKFTWAKCAKCDIRVITTDRCVMMICKCIYCADCSFRMKYCTSHRKITSSDFHQHRNPTGWYDLQIYNSIDLPIGQIAKSFKPEIIADLTKAKQLSINAIDYALFYKEDETYAAAVEIVKKVAKTYYAFGLNHVQINSIILANVHYLYQLLKRAHIYVASQ